MKPLLIDITELTFDKVQELVDKSYDYGYKDGFAAGEKSAPTITWPQPITVPTPNWYTTETPEWARQKYEFTCNEKTGPQTLQTNPLDDRAWWVKPSSVTAAQ